jgi:ribosomal protein L37E
MAPEVIFNFPFEVEHIIPVSRGGDDALENLALACRSCNLAKSNNTQDYDWASKAWQPVFNPRIHRWEEHFFPVQGEDVRILGLTATGRVTVSLLRMNRPQAIAARRQWARIGLYP